MMRFFVSFLLGCLWAGFPLAAQQLLPDGVSAARQRVWAAWCAELNADQALSLPKLRTLQEAAEGREQLPNNLEPHAQLRYYYGCKGQCPQGGFPLYLYLHGSGNPEDEWRVSREWALRFSDAPSAYFIPKIPNTGVWYRWYQASKQWAWEKLLQRALASPDIDPDRLYVFGISEGGYGAQRLAAFYADYWAAAGPMAGGEPLKNAPPENCEHIGFSLLTGSRDDMFCRNRLTLVAQEAFDSLQRLYPGSFDHRIDTVSGAGHGFDYRPTTPWLALHRRKSHPRHFSWENFPMGGRYREGFYNLRVDEFPYEVAPSPLSPDAVNHYDNVAPRYVYTLSIEDNEVNLRVERVSYEVLEKDSRWGIPIKFRKTRQEAHEGKCTLFFDEELVDLSRPVTIRVNGKRVFHGKLTLDESHIKAALDAFHDPRRLYPAAVQVVLP